jgi:DNA-binding MarR family transcriptional regulator
MEPTTFAALKAMEQLGYVKRRQAPDNRKNVYVHLTPKGRALKDKLVPLAEDVNRVAVAGLGDAEVARVRQALLAVIENLARDEAQSRNPERRIPSTREVARRVAAARPKRVRA